MRLFRSVVVLFAIFVLIGCGGGGGGGETPANSDTNITNTNSSNGDGKKTYSIDENSNNAIMGPLKDATVNVYRLTDLDKVVETTKTGELGAFSLKLENIPDDELLLVAISGGSDLDANDDGILDDNPTENKGTIHGFATAKELKDGKVNITLLSEIVYQYSKHLIGEVHPDDLKQAINIVSSKFLKDDTTRALKTYQDINSFLPIKGDSVKKLDFNYTSLLEGQGSVSNLYHHDFNMTKIEKELARIFKGKAISFRNLRLKEVSTNSKIILERALRSNITSTGTDLYFDYDANKSKLVDFVPKGTSITFVIDPQDEMKILGWEGCDKVSDDLLTCSLTASESSHRIVPNVIYKETKYADNVRDISNYQISINDNNYTVSLDLNEDSSSKEFINSIVPDDIIISTNPAYPFFRKVSAIKKVDDNNYIFTTSDVSFLKLYKQGSVFTNRYLTHEDLVPPNSSMNRSLLYKPHNGMRLLPPKHKNDDEFTIVFGEKENNLNRDLGDTSHGITVAIAKGINIKGSISFKLKPEFQYNIDWFSLKSMRFVTTKEMKVNLVIEATKEFELNEKICKKLGKPNNCNEFWKKRLAKYNFLVPGTPIVLDIELDASILLEAKIESSIEIGGEYTRVTKTGFNKVNGNFSVIDSTSTSGAMIGEIKPINVTAGEYLKLSPIILINEIAGIEFETKAGLYEEIAPLSLSTSNLDGDTNLFSGKVDARISAELKWVWSDWLAKFDWAKKLQTTINKKIREKTGGLNYVYTYNLFEWKGWQPGERPAYLKLFPDVGTRNIKYDDESISKHYRYKIKNEGEKTLEWKLEISGDLKQYISTSFVSDNKEEDNFEFAHGELEKGNDTYIDLYLEMNDLSSKIGKHQAILKFINLSNTDGTNSETGTTTEKITLKVVERIDPPSDLNVVLAGESIKNVKFSWKNGSTEDIHGNKIYMASYNTQTNSCNNNYMLMVPTLGDHENYQVPFEVFEKSKNENIKMEAGKKYCFKITSYKLMFDWFDTSFNESKFSNEAILEIPAYGSLQSSIIDAETKEPIKNAKVYLTSLANNTRTNDLGDYKFENLLPGKYKIVVEAEGYIRKEGQVTIKPNELERYQTELMMDKGLEGIVGTVEGKVKDAINGSGVSGVTIEIRKGTNILVGEPIKTITTDDNGNYSISLETGSYTFAISANGYSSSSETVDVIGNKNNQKDLPISPILSEGNVRIVLNWGENPRDLDSHLVKFNSDGSEKYHIYYSSHNVNDGNSPENKTPEGDQLDHDDTNGYGPETITINSLDNSAVYKYYVHDYSNKSNHNDTELKTSGVKVDVYSGDRRKTFYVPNEDGNVWKVFEIVNGEIVPCTNGCVFGVNGSTDSRIGSRDLVDSQENALFRNLPSKKD